MTCADSRSMRPSSCRSGRRTGCLRTRGRAGPGRPGAWACRCSPPPGRSEATPSTRGGRSHHRRPARRCPGRSTGRLRWCPRRASHRDPDGRGSRRGPWARQTPARCTGWASRPPCRPRSSPRRAAAPRR
jgi:hypothetical protein